MSEPEYIDIEVGESAIDIVTDAMRQAGWYYWGPAGGHARTTRDGESSWILRFGRSLSPPEMMTLELTKEEHASLRDLLRAIRHPSLIDLMNRMWDEQ